MVYLFQLKKLIGWFCLFLMFIYLGWNWAEKNLSTQKNLVVKLSRETQFPATGKPIQNKEINRFAAAKSERDEVIRHKMDQLYNKSRDEGLALKEREASLSEYYKLTSAYEDLRSLESMLSQKGYADIYIEWPENGKIKITVSKKVSGEEVQEIARLVKEITGISPEDLTIQYKVMEEPVTNDELKK